ncbi:ATP-binding protein [Streptomyces sp. YIM 98790]|uniref:ATP-binding protein n=1 Tax=Streptomyces sp. YIM 98790 TaxID=2689077 RepID=UPI00140DE7E6|nr:ATP-binding protein [Streptomyces sp. YIM 98790]
MEPREDQGPPSAHLALLEPATLAAAERYRSILLFADSDDTCFVARRMARETAADWGLAHLAGDMALCVSELVGNAVLHATPDGRSTSAPGDRLITVAFRAWPKWLFIEVSDEDSTPPMLPVGELIHPGTPATEPDDLLPDSGRGLFLVQTFANSVWWAPRDDGGKSVFCRFDLKPDTHR